MNRLWSLSIRTLVDLFHRCLKWTVRHWLACVLTLTVFALGMFAYSVANPSSFDERIKTLTAIGTAIGALALFGNLYFTGKTLEHQRETKFTERFYAAINQLGDEQREGVRLGAMYSLKTLYVDNHADREAILQVMCAFLRDRADPMRRQHDTVPRAVEHGLLTLGQMLEAHPRYNTAPRLRLGHLDFRGVIVERGRFSNVYFELSNFEGAHFVQCDFTDTCFIHSTLRKTTFTNCNMDRAALGGADLHGASLSQSHGLSWKQLEPSELTITTTLPDYLVNSKPEWLEGRLRRSASNLGLPLNKNSRTAPTSE